MFVDVAITRALILLLLMSVWHSLCKSISGILVYPFIHSAIVVVVLWVAYLDAVDAWVAMMMSMVKSVVRMWCRVIFICLNHCVMCLDVLQGRLNKGCHSSSTNACVACSIGVVVVVAFPPLLLVLLPECVLLGCRSFGSLDRDAIRHWYICAEPWAALLC